MAYLRDIVLNFDNIPGLHVAVYATAIPRFHSTSDATDIVALTVVNCDNLILSLPTLMLRLTSLQYLYIRQSTASVSSRFVADCSEKVIKFLQNSSGYRTRLELLLDASIGQQCVAILNTDGYPFCRNLENVVLAVPDIDPDCVQQALAWCDLTLKVLLFYPTGMFCVASC